MVQDTDKIVSQLIENNIAIQKKAVEMISSMNSLTKRIDKMLDLFEEAAEQIKVSEEHEMKPLVEKLEALIEQNKTIAKGLIMLEKYVRGSGILGTKEFKPSPLKPGW